jgi:hypothetical protein
MPEKLPRRRLPHVTRSAETRRLLPISSRITVVQSPSPGTDHRTCSARPAKPMARSVHLASTFGTNTAAGSHQPFEQRSLVRSRRVPTPVSRGEIPAEVAGDERQLAHGGHVNPYHVNWPHLFSLLSIYPTSTPHRALSFSLD